jgi:hypothetical protein
MQTQPLGETTKVRMGVDNDIIRGEILQIRGIDRERDRYKEREREKERGAESKERRMLTQPSSVHGLWHSPVASSTQQDPVGSAGCLQEM